MTLHEVTNAHILLQNVLSVSMGAIKTIEVINRFESLLEPPPQMLHLSSLETLSLKGVKMDFDDLRHLLASSRIKKLEFIHSQLTLLSPRWSKHQLKLLEHLNMNGSTINIRALFKLLDYVPQLKYLRLNDIVASGEMSRHDADVCLDNLTMLYAQNCKIPMFFLATIIWGARNLEHVFLQNYAYIDDIPKGVWRHPKLKKLRLENVHISANTLGLWLKQCQHLEQLTLRDCQGLRSGLKDSDNIQLPELTHLDLTRSDVDLNTLSWLLSHAPQLRKLIVPGCQSLNLDKLNTRQLPNLVTLKTRGSQMNSGFHKALQAKSKTLNPSPVENQNALAKQRPSPTPQYANQPASLDADTRDNQGTTFDVTRVFFAKTGHEHPGVSQYRLSTYNRLEVNPLPCAMSHAFTRCNNPEMHWDSNKQIPQPVDDVYGVFSTSNDPQATSYYGKYEFVLSTDWQALPSLSPNERLLAYNVAPLLSIEIQYSKRDNLYYVKAKDKHSCQRATIDYVVQVPLCSQPLPSEIEQLANTYRHFQSKALKIKEAKPTGKDYLLALQQQQTGACRHRAALFLHEMKQKFPLHPVRIVTNACHAFVEVQLNGQGPWITINLGGYPVSLTIHSPPAPQIKPQQAQVPEANRIPNPEPTPSATPPMALTTETETCHMTATGVIRPKKTYFENVAQKKPITNMLQLAQHSLQTPKMLLKVKNDEELSALRFELLSYCKHTSKPCYFVNQPEELLCSSDFLTRDEQQRGVVHKGPGGPLHDFLTHPNHKNGVLIINFGNFKTSDVVRFNTILDKEPSADGTPLPKSMSVTGLINPDNPHSYSGRDFTSRFSAMETVAVKLPSYMLPPERPLTEHDACLEIDFYDQPDWESALFGVWQLKGQSLFFQQSDFIKEHAKGQTRVVFKNAPWQNDAFVNCVQKLTLGYPVDALGKTFRFEATPDFYRTSGYDFSPLKPYVRLASDSARDEAVHVLNEATLGDFFGEYVLEEKHIYHQQGLIERAKGQTLSVYVSHVLPEPLWAKLLHACQKEEVALLVRAAANAGLPKGLELEKQPLPLTLTSFNITQVVCQDREYALHALGAEGKDDVLVLDISEISAGDLLGKLSAANPTHPLAFEFQQEQGLLDKVLDTHQTVILNGTFSEELQQRLTDYLLKRQKNNPITSQLILQTAEASAFSLLPVRKLQVTLEEKRAALGNKVNLSETELKSHCIAKLRAMASCGDEHTPWQGMHKLPRYQKPLEQSGSDEEQADAFDKRRLQQVSEVLGRAPFVFLAGMTGVGKTTFVQEVLAKQPRTTVHMGEDHILDWVLETSEGVKYLFLDEANITSRQWSAFEGLYHTPPYIVVGNTRHLLSKEHKVIFAGNPLSYGGERTLPSLFERHGNALVFERLPKAYLSARVLKPILSPLFQGKDLGKVLEVILAVEAYLTDINPEQVLISPRELAMMALLTANDCRENKSLIAVTVAKHYAYTLAKTHVPNAYANAFDKQFKPEVHERDYPKLPSFLINETNYSAYDAITSQLRLRMARKEHLMPVSGGLGGVILEGAPGIGKSMLVAQILAASGMKKNQDFYIIPASMPLSDKITLLLKAFNEGAVVIIDEINSSAMMEQLLNALLMGKTPDGKRAIQPGFMIIGTQNPSEMGGRLPTPEALRHRLHMVHLPDDYTKEEMIAILQQKELPLEAALDMVTEYQTKSHDKGLCFRDLLNRAEVEVRALKRISKTELPSTEQSKTEPQTSIDLLNQSLKTFGLFNNPLKGNASEKDEGNTPKM